MEAPMESIGSSELVGLSEAERADALQRFHQLRPFLEEAVPFQDVAAAAGISVRTARYWLGRYRKYGLAGLARKPRDDRGQARVSCELREFVEGLALHTPRLSVAVIHREAVTTARTLGEPAPSYAVVRRLIRKLPMSLVTMAHEGNAAYGDSFDLIHRRDAAAPNAIWQADHSELDILVEDNKGKPRKPWLTIVLDDYSRAIAGYFLFFTAPSAINTALALRQAIWRKPHAGWHICGIPQVLYTDHGSDFTSRHLEQVTVDLKIRTIFSSVGRPRGRGKVERFFESLSQVFLSRLPGYRCSKQDRRGLLSLSELGKELEQYLINEYLVTPHRATGEPPQARWEAGGFLPQMPLSLEQLDLLLLTVPQSRRVHSDGIRFMALRFIDPTLAAFVGEDVVLRYDPRDMAEIRVFYQGTFLCRAVCQELAGETVSLRDIVRARDRRRRELRRTLQDRRRVVDSLLEAKRWTAEERPLDSAPEPEVSPVKLKRYVNE